MKTAYDTTKLKNLLINDNGFAFDPSTGHTYNLSMTALAVIRMLKEGADDKTVLTRLTDTYDVTDSRAVNDLDVFIGALCQYGLMVSRAETGDAT